MASPQAQASRSRSLDGQNPTWLSSARPRCLPAAITGKNLPQQPEGRASSAAQPRGCGCCTPTRRVPPSAPQNPQETSSFPRETLGTTTTFGTYHQHQYDAHQIDKFQKNAALEVRHTPKCHVPQKCRPQPPARTAAEGRLAGASLAAKAFAAETPLRGRSACGSPLRQASVAH